MAKSERKWKPTCGKRYWSLRIGVEESDISIDLVSGNWGMGYEECGTSNTFKSRSQALKAKLAILKVLGG